VRAVPESPDEAVEEASQVGVSLARDGAVALPNGGAPRGLVVSLLGSARHELRSPLQSIQGFAELLESEAYGRLTREQLTFVEHILQGSIELGSIFDACVELTEEELLGRTLELHRSALGSTLSEALTSAAASTRSTLEYHFEAIGDKVRVKLDLAALKRALSCLLRALAAGEQQTFRAEFTADVELGRLRLVRGEAPRAEVIPVGELAQLRGTCRGLIWLRLADVLLEKQGALLLVSESVDQAEVRLRLSSTH